MEWPKRNLSLHSVDLTCDLLLMVTPNQSHFNMVTNVGICAIVSTVNVFVTLSLNCTSLHSCVRHTNKCVSQIEFRFSPDFDHACTVC